MDRDSPKPYLMFITSMLIFGSIGLIRSYIPLSSGLLACLRGVLGSLFLVIFIKLRGGKLFGGLGRKRFWLLALSGAIMGTNWMLLFEAFNRTGVAVATLCYYMEPTIIILLSPLVFGERLTPRKLLCVGLSLVGIVLVSGVTEPGGFAQVDLGGIALALGSAVLYAAVVILNKKISVEDVYQKTLIQLAFSAAALLPWLLIGEDFSAISLTPGVMGLVLIAGIVHTGLAYVLYFGSVGMLETQTVALLSYIDPVSALLFSALLLQEKLSPGAIAGAVLIIGAAVLGELKPRCRV